MGVWSYFIVTENRPVTLEDIETALLQMNSPLFVEARAADGLAPTNQVFRDSFCGGVRSDRLLRCALLAFGLPVNGFQIELNCFRYLDLDPDTGE